MNGDITRRSLIRKSSIFGFGGLLGKSHASYTKNLFNGSDIERTRVSSQKSTVSSELFHDIPAFRTNAFIVPVYARAPFLNPKKGGDGWESPTELEKLRTLLKLHPEAFAPRDFGQITCLTQNKYINPTPPRVDFDPVVREAIEFSFKSNVGIDDSRRPELSEPFGSEEHDIDDRYECILKKNDWRYPDGTPVESVTGLGSKSFDGELIRAFGIIPSHFAPGTLDITNVELEAIYNNGKAAVYHDGILGPVEQLDFSRWAINSFQEYLSDLPTGRLDELGITDPGSFDIKLHLENQGLSPQPLADDKPNPAVDPVFREFVLHTHRQYRDYIDSYRSSIEETFPERTGEGTLQMYGNQNFGDRISGDPVSTVYVSDHMDIMSFEDSGGTLPPEYIRDFTYKLGIAAGRYDKPVWVEGRMNESSGSLRGLDPEKRYPMLMRMKHAEAYANGARRMIPLQHGDSIETSLNHWLQADNTISDSLLTFIDFLWAHKRFVDPESVNSANDVAVILSLPTLLWRYRPQWDLGRPNQPTEHAKSFRGTVKLLREAQITYDVLIFGHPELWTDETQLDKLPEYEAIVLPEVESISTGQTEALESYLSKDGVVVTSGPAPDRTEMFESQSIPDVFEHDSAFVLESNPGKARVTDGEDDGTLVQTLLDQGVLSRLREDYSVGVNHLHQPDTERHILHLINYDYDESTDSFSVKSDLDLLVPNIDSSFETARFYSPQTISDVEVSVQAEHHEIQVPELTEWGFVVLARSETDLNDEESADTTKSLIQSAKEELDASGDGGPLWSQEFSVIAEEKINAANTAFDYNSYTLAAETAREARTAAQKIVGETVIAIDRAHGQPESEDEKQSLDPIQREFSGYDYRFIHEWNEGTLADIDVLIIPPALKFKDVEYGFSEAEISQIDSFVSSGGGLSIMVRGGYAPDLDQLTSRFGFEFNGDSIVSSAGQTLAETSFERHRLTHPVDRIDFGLGTPVESMPDDATVVASMPEDTDAWLHQEAPIEERQEDEPSAAGEPVYSVFEHGQGLVAAMGTHHYLYFPTDRPGDDVMQNLCEVLSRYSGHERTIGEFDSSPRDPDGDGFYEDVTGDGEVDSDDAAALINNLDDPTIKENPTMFDFNEDGNVTEQDGQALYLEQYGEIRFTDVLEIISDFNTGGVPSFKTVLDAISRFNDKN